MDLEPIGIKEQETMVERGQKLLLRSRLSTGAQLIE